MIRSMENEARSMNTGTQKLLKYLLPLLVVGVSVTVSYALIAQAQSESTIEAAVASGITFPVPDLGNCGSKNECRDYCDKPGNMETCIKFAQSHGLMSKGEAEQGLKYQKRILSGSAPGGCNSPDSCKEICSDINNLESCLKFADEQGFKEGKVDEARKIHAYLKSGGKMPGGCTSETSCRSYCSDFNHAEECFAFAEQAGLDIEKEAGGEKLDRDQFKKFIELAKNGQTPGGCKSKEQCESYCQSETNKEECIAFGQKMGFMDEKKAEMFRKTGGKGPGGCNSEESCKAYCNDPGNQESCFKFAEEHNLINQDEIKNAKEGFVRLRQGLEQAPPEVASCLKSTLGTNIIEDIQSGNLTPGPQIGDRVKGCFERFGHKSDAREGFDKASSGVSSCVREKLGDVFEKVKSGELTPTPEMGDAFRVCGEQLKLFRGGEGDGHEGSEGGQDVNHFLRSAPPGVSSCLKEKLGGDFVERAKEGGTPPGQEVKATLRECFESFRPEAPKPHGDDTSDYEKGFRPADFNEVRKFIRHDGSSAPEGSRPGLNRETFEKFRQEGGLRPPEGTPESFKQQFQQQFQSEFQKQYDQQYQQQYQQQQQPPPSGETYHPPTAPPPTTEPASTPPPPTTEPAPAPAPMPPPTEEPKTQGNIWGAVKAFFGF